MVRMSGASRKMEDSSIGLFILYINPNYIPSSIAKLLLRSHNLELQCSKPFSYF